MSRALLATCVAAAARAAEIIRGRSHDRRSLDWEMKSRADFVTDVDRAAEHAIVDVVSSRHADGRILGEELSPTMQDRSGLTFVVDPLDGTTNFLHGVPWYAVSIAALVDGELTAGVVLDVANGELFTATAGGGARLNGQPITVSPITEPGRALIGTGFPFKDGSFLDTYLQMMKTMITHTAGLRRPGAAALDLAYVAAGSYDGFFEVGLNPWDVAAGSLLVLEAGGLIGDLGGEGDYLHGGQVIAANPKIFSQMVQALSPFRAALERDRAATAAR